MLVEQSANLYVDAVVPTQLKDCFQGGLYVWDASTYGTAKGDNQLLGLPCSEMITCILRVR
ncbi:hypothetical protein G9274_000329 [Stenotrophomonas rhizophila]|nr:hypothetical protein G9274_000329 [Stenotrophomonas rhizophila]